MDLNNNDILRSIRYTFDLSDKKMGEIFGLAGHQVTPGQVGGWLKTENDPGWLKCSDAELANFLNGLIYEKRGKQEGSEAIPEAQLTNNIIFRKLKIALNLKADEVLAILDLADLHISQHQLSAFFRRPDHKHYRTCNDQVLRNFLKGMQLKYRAGMSS